MNVILIGYRGSGKTSIGRRLADQLWKTFVDVDAETRKRFAGRDIAAIWATDGEPAWREAEAEVTRSLLARDDLVIGLGGGTPMIPAAREAIASATDARRIYLRCDAAELHRRIMHDPETSGSRPSLTTHGDGLAEVQNVLAQREPTYRELADEEFDVTHVNVEDAVRYLIQRCL